MDNDLTKTERPERWVTRDLATYAHNVKFTDFPDHIVALAKTYILDSIGCMIGGIRSPIGKSMASVVGAMGGAPQASILGGTERTSMVSAALINGTTCNAMDFDETLTGIGHPGSSFIPAALAVGEKHGISGRELITAVLVGYEVGNRIGFAIQPSQERAKDVWFVGTWQAMSSVAAAAKALDLDLEQTLNAYGIAGATAPLPNSQKWGWPMYERPIHWVKEPTGWPAWTGTLAALLAADGFLGNRFILDGDTGFWRMAGSDRCDFDAMTAGLGTEYTIRKVGLKPFPCCRWQHSLLHCVQKLRDEHRIDVTDVAKVEIYAFDWIKAQELYGPRSVVDSQFSVPHAVTMVLRGVKPGAAWTTDDLLLDEQLIEWSRRISVTVDSGWTQHFHETGKIGSRVDITLTDGTILTHQTDCPPGDIENPMSEAEVRDKFLGLTEDVLGHAQAGQLYNSLMGLEKIGDIRELAAMCVTQ